MPPLFSIIIPTYNAQKTISSCLKSVLTQKSNFEIIIVDGKSNDTTLEIIRRKKENSTATITVLSEPDSGVYDAMNKGIDLAKGEWLYFLGSDDVLLENILPKIEQYIPNIPEPKFIYGSVIHPRFASPYDGIFTLSKLMQNNICHQAIFYHKSIFLKYGKYNVDFITGADYDMNLRIFFKNGMAITYIPEVIAKYGGNGLSISTKDTNFIQNKFLLIHQYNNLKLSPLQQKTIAKNLVREYKLKHNKYKVVYNQLWFMYLYLLVKITKLCTS